MNAATPKPLNIRLALRQCAAAIVNRTLQASLIITRYSYWFLSVFVFFSCQKNLTRTDDSTRIISQKAEPLVEKFIVIDTTEYSVSDHVSSLSLPDAAVYRKIQDKINRFYPANSWRTKWMGADGPDPLYHSLLDHLKNAAHYGLNPDAYAADHIEQCVNTLYKNKPAASKDLIDADLLVTETFFLFAIHLREGRITNPGSGDKIWIVHQHPADHPDVALLASAKDASELDGIIKRLQPATDQYAKLQKALIFYRGLEKSDTGQLLLPARASIKAGNRHATIPAIRRKLVFMDFPVSAPDEHTGEGSPIDSLYYDQGLVSAVKTFQQRCGLEPDGIIKGKTLTFLNQSFREMADLIALNMERMRWQPDHHATPCIRVNIPEYRLRIYEQGKQALEMNVIVGAVDNATPVFSDTLEHVVFSPTWTVPPKIIREEFLPRLRRDSLYYSQRKNFVFFKKGIKIDPSTERWDGTVNARDYRIVQQPGPDNALGSVKFIMPNDMNIYLHDTPDHKPFALPYRALSHGCIRLDDPAKFAACLLQEEAGWDLTNIKKAMASGKPTKIPLRKQYEVHLEYHTVWADDEGNLNFREDIYGHDKRQLQRLYQADSAANAVASR